MKIITKEKEIFGKLALDDTFALTEGFKQLQFTNFEAAATKAKSDQEIADDEAEKARVKEVGGGVLRSILSTTQHTHTHTPPPRRRRIR